LGYTVGRLLDEIGSDELTEWQAFALLEPFGGTVDDLRAGLAPAAALNLNRAEGKEPISALAFFPWHDKEPEPEPEPASPEEVARAWRELLNRGKA